MLSITAVHLTGLSAHNVVPVMIMFKVYAEPGANNGIHKTSALPADLVLNLTLTMNVLLR